MIVGPSFSLYRVRRFVFVSLRSASLGRSAGRITSAHRRGGANFFNSFRIDRFRSVSDRIGFVVDIIRRKFAPSAALVSYESGFYGVIPCVTGLEVGTTILASKQDPLPCLPGFTMQLAHIAVGTLISGVAFAARSAGTAAKLLRQFEHSTLVELPSGRIYTYQNDISASVGALDNAERRLHKFRKAGELFLYGRRPHVRGTAMNPVDHPHGGGQGKTSGGRPSVSATARLTKGYKTNRKR